MILFKIVLLLLSFKGYFWFFTKKLGFHFRSGPFITLLFLGNFLFIGSMINLLLLFTYIFYIMGLIFFIWSYISNRKFIIINLKFVDIFSIVVLIIFVISFLNTQLVHYDNFSHWATIVKFLNIENQLPGEFSKIIEFNSYPVGTALVLYYFTKTLVFSESILIISQFFIILASIYSLFIIVRDERRLLPQVILYLFVGLSFTFSVSIGLDNLLVDYLISIIGISGLINVIYYRNNFKKVSLIVLLTLNFLFIIKNSAIFFGIPIIIFYLYTSFSRKKLLLRIIKIFLVILSSFISYFTWNRHVVNTFKEIGKHSVNLDEYQNIFNEKNVDTIDLIGKRFITETFSLNNLTTLGIIIGLIIMLILHIIVSKKRKINTVFIVLVLSIFSIIIYYAGIYYMFIFSMPTEEAIVLAGYERYTASMTVYILIITGVLLAYYGDCLFYESDVSSRNYKSFASVSSKKLYQIFTTYGIVFIFLFFLSEQSRIISNNSSYKETLPYMVKEAVGNNFYSDGSSYLIISSNDKEQISSYYLHKVSSYYLWSEKVEAFDLYYTYSQEEFNLLLKKYDYIVVVEENISFSERIWDEYQVKLKSGIYPTKLIFTK